MKKCITHLFKLRFILINMHPCKYMNELTVWVIC